MEMITLIKEYWEPDRSQIFMTKSKNVDVNAAKNILGLGQQSIASTLLTALA